MARPSTRTTQLLRDEALALRSLFGTARNAYARLRLETTHVSFAEFQRATGWQVITPSARDTIRTHWRLWAAHFLRDEAHTLPSTFTLPLDSL